MISLKAAREWQRGLANEIKQYPEWDILSDDQLIAIYGICCGEYKCVNLTGRAGSGKTFVVKFCRKLLEQQQKEVRVIGSTGVAAQNAGGESTINRFCGLGLGKVLPLGMLDMTPGNTGRKSVAACANQVKFNFLSINYKGVREREMVIFVEEVSMASSEVLLLMYKVIAENSRNRNVRFVTVGDLRQLLPVNAKEKDLPYTMHGSLCFERAKFQAAGDETIREYGSLLHEGPFRIVDSQPQLPEGMVWNTVSLGLVTNHRQKGSDGWFINALNALGDGKNFSDPVVAPLRGRVWVKNEQGEYINLVDKTVLDLADPKLKEGLHLYNRNLDVKTQNDEVLKEAKAAGKKSVQFPAFIKSGAWSESEILGELSPIGAVCEVVEGLKFMVRINLNESLANGTMGKIIEIRNGTDLADRRLKLELPNGEQHWLPYTEVPLPIAPGTGNPVGSFMGIPGVPCHALTPWKCQGLTIKDALLYYVRENYGTHGLMYVVASRVSNPENLFILVQDAKQLNKVVRTDKKVREYIQTTEQFMLDLIEQDVEVVPTYVRKDDQGSRVGFEFTVANTNYWVIYEDGVLVESALLKNNEYVEAPAHWVEAAAQVVANGLLAPLGQFINPVQMLETLEDMAEEPEVAEAIVFEPHAEKAGYLWVDDCLVQEVAYVAEPTKGEVSHEEWDYKIYKLGELKGLCVLDRESVINRLRTDADWLAGFKAHVKYVWFKP